MDQLTAEPREKPALVSRVWRFLGYFCLVAALLEVVMSVSQVRFLWQYWLAIARAGQLLRTVEMTTNLLLTLAALWLVIISFGIIKGWNWARRGLFIWAIVVVTTQSTYGAVAAQRLSTSSIRVFPSVAESLLRWFASLAFPVTILSLMALRSIIEKSKGGGRGAFQVLQAQFDSPDTHDPNPSTSGDDNYWLDHLFRNDVIRIITWVGLGLAVTEILRQGIIFYFHRYSWNFSGRNARLIVVDIIERLLPLTHILLLIGSALMLWARRQGARLVLWWAIVFLALIVLRFILYDVMHVWWVATKPTPEPQSWPIHAVSAFNQVIHASSFAILALYLLWQPEIAGTYAKSRAH